MRRSRRKAIKLVSEMLCLALALGMLLCAIPVSAAEAEATDVVDESKPETVDIVVVAQDVPQGTRLTDKHYKVVTVPNVNIPANVISDPMNVDAKYAAIKLYEGEYIYQAQLSSQPTVRATDSVLIKPITKCKSNFIIVTDFIKANTGEPVDYHVQKLIDENPNRTIYFPKGEYVFASPVATPAKYDESVSIILDDGAVVKASKDWKAIGDWNALFCLGASVPYNGVGPGQIGSYYSIRGGVLDCNGKSEGISIDSGRESVIRSLCIINTKTGINVKKGANNVSSDCDFEDLIIVGNGSSSSVGMSITGYDNTFTNIKIYNVKTGVTGIGAGNFFKSISVINNIPDKLYNGTLAFAGTGNNWYENCYVENMETAYSLGATGMLWDCTAVWNNDACVKQVAVKGGNNTPVIGFRAQFHKVEGAQTTFCTAGNKKSVMGCIFDASAVTDKAYENGLLTAPIWVAG